MPRALCSHRWGPLRRTAVAVSAALVWLAGAEVAPGQQKYEPYAVSTLVGISGRAGSFDGAASAPWFTFTYGVAVDRSGNVYVADRGSHTIRKISPDGSVHPFAGIPHASGRNDGNGSTARFDGPQGVATDQFDNLYVADTVNCTIRKITAEGVVSTLAGVAGACGTADGFAGGARFNAPFSVAVAPDGDLLVADTYNHTIRKITPAGAVTTVAGLPQNWGSADGTGSQARFDNPAAVAVDSGGTIYVADAQNHTVRKISPGGAVSTLAGRAGYPGSADGVGPAARFISPKGVAVDAAGDVYVADMGNHTIRKITASGAVTTFAGSPGLLGARDGIGAAARFYSPYGLTSDSAGNLYVGDTSNSLVRKVTTADAVVTTIAGHGGFFNRPSDVALDGAGNLYIADSENSTIRKMTPEGIVTTVAGLAGVTGRENGTGSDARFDKAARLALDGHGNIYVADRYNPHIRKITPERVVSTVAGSAYQSGNLDGAGGNARFRELFGVALDRSGNVYVADIGNHNIRKITPDGIVSTFAGPTGEFPREGSTDGDGINARFNTPTGLVVDADGNVFVADSKNHTIRKISAAGAVSTFAGVAGTAGHTDGIGTAARFLYPTAVDIDGSGNLYVIESMNNTLRKIKPDGTVTTLAGRAWERGSTDARGSLARFQNPYGIAVDRSGKLFIADMWNHTIRTAVPAPPEILSITRTSGNAVRLRCFGVPDAPNRIEYSRDLTTRSFQTLATIAVDQTGDFQFEDRDAGTRKFYRLVHP